MNEIRVNTWNELADQLYADAWREPLGRFRSTLAFRGMQDAGDVLTTTLARLGGDATCSQEAHLLRNFRKYAHRGAVSGDSLWNWLALGQHHGLPTRLLDWTFSPFVALHFATQDLGCFGVDGVVWCVDYVKAHATLPEPLRAALAAEQADVFTTEMLELAAPNLNLFDELNADEPFVLFLDPPSLDDRIVNQFAILSIMNSATANLGEWLATRPDLWRRVIIPAALKWEVRDKLDQANITERVLFPGLDGLSRWLTRYYSPRVGPVPKEPTSSEQHKGDSARHGDV